VRGQVSTCDDWLIVSFSIQNSLVPGSIDLLCLPEMIFTGKEKQQNRIDDFVFFIVAFFLSSRRLRFRECVCDTSVPGTSADGRHVPVLCVGRAEIGVPRRGWLSRAVGARRSGEAHDGTWRRGRRRRERRGRRGCRWRQQRRRVWTGWHARRTLSQVPPLSYGQAVGKAR
jgi:hypothetical protein